MCNKKDSKIKYETIVSIPFISGQCVMKLSKRDSSSSVVSIPFISGQCVILKEESMKENKGFNPLYIGSMCNNNLQRVGRK